MKQKDFKFNEKFFNFLYHALLEKLNTETEKSKYFDKEKLIDERFPMVIGDFFEQVLGVDRNDVLNRSYEKIGHFFSPEHDSSDPVVANILYATELVGICGHEELEFDEIYPLKVSN